MNRGQLEEIILLHEMWLVGNPKGKRANLESAHLEGANLCGANLEGANLEGANLYGANLYGSHLEGANLCGANGIIQFGPLGKYKRIGYAVKHSDCVMVKLGCFWGPEKQALKSIKEKYGPRSSYAQIVRAVCRELEEGAG